MSGDAIGSTGPVTAVLARFWFERAGDDDLPFYNGRPAAIRPLGWLFVMASVALGFAALIMPVPALQKGLAGFVPAVLYFAIPLAALAIVAPRNWTALFRRIGPRDVAWMFAFALLNIAVTVVVAVGFLHTSPANANPVMQMLAKLPMAERAVFYVRTIPQLFGEEVMTILPFLAILTLLTARAGVARQWAIVLAWIAASLLFGAAHLPTYGWNFMQCFVVIGSARLVLLLPYIVTRNIWVSAGAHIVNDWLLFTVALALMGMGAT